MVFTLFPKDTHQDHRNASLATVSASKSVDQILFYEVPSTENLFRPNVYYDITDYFHLKEKGLRYHTTQKDKPYVNLAALHGLAKFRAYQCGCDGLFEAFSLYKDVRR
jgi:LmbE family N-acetylglucosaminyl deacetylase